MKIVQLGRATTARVRLLCLPHAGGSAYVFRNWPAHLPPWLEILGVELPGRGQLIRQPPLDRMGALVDRLGPLIAPLLDRPYIVFGHSMGALLGFEATRWCKRHNLRQPQTLFVSGLNAPQEARRQPVHHLPTDALLAEVDRLEGLPSAVFEDPELRDLFVAILRADMAAVETHEFAAEPPLSCDLEALVGDEDPWVSVAQVDRWRELTTGRTAVTRFPGGHFFVQTAERAVVELVARAASAACRE